MLGGDETCNSNIEDPVENDETGESAEQQHNQENNDEHVQRDINLLQRQNALLGQFLDSFTESLRGLMDGYPPPDDNDFFE